MPPIWNSSEESKPDHTQPVWIISKDVRPQVMDVFYYDPVSDTFKNRSLGIIKDVMYWSYIQ